MKAWLDTRVKFVYFLLIIYILIERELRIKWHDYTCILCASIFKKELMLLQFEIRIVGLSDMSLWIVW